MPQGSTDFRPQAAASFVGFADIYFGVGQYSNVRFGKWQGRNDQLNSLKWGGNKATGARSLAVNAAQRFEIGGKVTLGAGLLINGFEVWQAYQNNDMYGVGRAGIDAIISGASAAGGPPGWAIGTTYFGLKFTGATDSLVEWIVQNNCSQRSAC